MGAPIDNLRDDFEDGLIAAAWTASVAGSATVTEAAGRATLTLPSSVVGSHQAVLHSTSAYNFTGDGCYWNINSMVATGVAATITLDAYLDGSNALRWSQTSGTLKAQKVVAGVGTDLYSAAWSGTTYKYLRIRESGGTVFFDSSTNGTSWTNRASIVGLPFAVTDLFVQMTASCGNVASPGALKIEDFNLILPALSTTWHWTEIEWPLLFRFRNITIAATSGQGYVATYSSKDASGAPIAPTYWAGPQNGGRELTQQASQATAQALAVDLPTDGRWDLPTQIECRFIRLYHRSTTGSSYTIREYYARRLIQADDIEAEFIRGMTILGHQLVVDQLSALTGDVGTLTAGVIDGVTIYAGGGKIKLYSVGQQMLVTPPVTTTALFWTSTVTNTDIAAIDMSSADLGSGTYNAQMTIRAGRTDTPYKGGTLNLQAFSDTQTAAIIIDASEGIGPSIDLQAPVTADSLNLGTAFGAAAGQLITSGVIAIRGAAININTAISAKGVGATNATAAVTITNSAAAISFQVLDDKTIRTGTGNRWDLRGFVSGGGTVIGHVDVLVDGTLRRLAVI